MKGPQKVKPIVGTLLRWKGWPLDWGIVTEITGNDICVHSLRFKYLLYFDQKNKQCCTDTEFSINFFEDRWSVLSKDDKENPLIIEAE